MTADVPAAQVARELAVRRTTINTWLGRPDAQETHSSRPQRTLTRIPRRWRRQIGNRPGQRWSGRRIS